MMIPFQVVYYHDGKPRWNEVARVLVPVELYHQVSLREK